MQLFFSGVDIAAFLEAIGAGEKLVEKLRNSNSTMGYIAISYALYKIATPVRYTVTLGSFFMIHLRFIFSFDHFLNLNVVVEKRSIISLLSTQVQLTENIFSRFPCLLQLFKLVFQF